MAPGVARRWQEDCRRAVDDSGRIAGVVHEIDVEIGVFLQNQVAIGRALVVERVIRHRAKGRLQPGKRFKSGLRPRIFFSIERKAAVLAMNSYETLVEVTVLDGGGRPLLALKPQAV